MFGPRSFLYVYKLPEKLSAGFCFSGGNPITFLNIDFFEADNEMPRHELVAYIRGKRYYDPRARYLVLSAKPEFTFAIEKPEAEGATQTTEGADVSIDPR